MNKLLRYKNMFFCLIVTIVIGVVIGTIIMFGLYILPVEKMEKNVFKSIHIFEEEGRFPQLVEGENFVGTCLDNYTDAIMLNSAIYSGNENALEKSMRVYRKEYEETADTVESLIEYSRGNKGYDIHTYERYWHGYLAYLKPLLLIFSYGQIRIFNAIVQLILTIIAIALMWKKTLKKYIFAFVITILFLLPLSIPLSLQLASVYYVLIISIIVMIKNDETLYLKERYFLFFCIVGMWTSFIDFLTYPLVTLGLPLAMMFAMHEQDGWKIKVRNVIENSICWGIGYIGMWSGKWIMASIILKENVLKNAANSIGIRTSFNDFEVSFNYLDVLSINLSVYDNFIGKGILICMVLGIVYYSFIKNKLIFSKKNILNIVPFILIFTMPFVWYLAASNHVYIHYRFTFRIYVIAFFALQCAIIQMSYSKNK